MTTDVKVATPPKMVCQNCGLGIFNSLALGVRYLHSVTGKAECKVGRSRRAKAKRAAREISSETS